MDRLFAIAASMRAATSTATSSGDSGWRCFSAHAAAADGLPPPPTPSASGKAARLPCGTRGGDTAAPLANITPGVGTVDGVNTVADAGLRKLATRGGVYSGDAKERDGESGNENPAVACCGDGVSSDCGADSSMLDGASTSVELSVWCEEPRACSGKVQTRASGRGMRER